jgi:ABC-type sugar transport system ATPase subunit
MAENVALTALRRLLSWHGLVNARERATVVRRTIERLGIVPPDPAVVASRLSGGNQQKVVLARAIAANSDVLILDQPTAGVDVGAKADIYREIDNLARDGVAILLISDDLDEMLKLCDRIVVMRRGVASPPVPASAFDRPTLLQEISGGIIATDKPAA